MFRRAVTAGLIALATLATLPGVVRNPKAVGAAEAPPLFTDTRGFATKTGFRGVFSWQATAPVTGVVHFGEAPDALTRTVQPVPGVPDTAQVAVVDGLTIGKTYWWKVVDGLTGESSEVKSFVAANAYNAWDGKQYTLNLLVHIDAQALPQDVPSDVSLNDMAEGMNIFAERLYDATDGFARLGEVLITDTNLDYAGNVPNSVWPNPGIVCPPQPEGAPQLDLADVVVQTTVPMDSHTWGGFAIANPCTSFYIGRVAQLGGLWVDDLHLGYVSTHELMHYAFNAPDLYPLQQQELPADPQCRNLTWDGSVMHNTGGWTADGWELTELDRNPTLTPCDMGDPSAPFSWAALRERYTHVPERPAGPIEHVRDLIPRGGRDGGALHISVLDREPRASTLATFTPIDTGGVVCKTTDPQIVDPEGDANGVLGQGTPLPSEPNLDVTKAYLTYDAGTKAITFHVKVKDVTEAMTVPHGEFFDFDFSFGTGAYFIDLERTATNGEKFVLGWTPPISTENPDPGRETLAEGLAGDFDAVTDEITAVLPLATFNAATSGTDMVPTTSVLTDFGVVARRVIEGKAINVIPDADTATGQCTYAIGQEHTTGGLPPVAVADVATTAEDVPLDIDVLANDSDPEGLALTLVETTSTAKGATAILGGKVRYTPTLDSNGTDTFTYVVSDAGGAESTGTATVTVTPVVDAPRLAPDSLTVSPVLTTIPVLANDVDPDKGTLTVTSVTQGAFGSVYLSGGTVAYDPGHQFLGSDTFTYTVRNTAGLTATSTVTLTNAACMRSTLDDLEPTADAGWVKDPAVNDTPVSPTWTEVLDPFAHSLTHSWATAADSTGAKDDRLVMPTFRALPSTRLGFWHRYSLEDGFDGGVLEVSKDGGPFVDILLAGGSISTGGYTGVIDDTVDSPNPLHGRLAWTGDSQYVDAMTEVRVELGALAGHDLAVRFRLGTDALVPGTLPAWFLDDVAVSGAALGGCTSGGNRSPRPAADSARTRPGRAVTVDVLANDVEPDGDAMSLMAVSTPAHGTATRSGGTVTYVPAAGFVGTDIITYTVTDSFGASATAQLVVTVAKRPTAGDFDGDGKADIASYTTGTGRWYVRPNSTGVVWGAPSTDVPVAADYDGDGRTDLAVYRPTTAAWFVRGAATTTWGKPGDLPVPGDYDGDGKADLAIFRPAEGVWAVKGQPFVKWGQKGDLPAAGDYDGDEKTDIAVFRPSTGVFYVLGGSAIAWGRSGDVPVVADYTGDGKADVAVFRPSDGTWYVLGAFARHWGTSTDKPVPADYDGDGKADTMVFRAAERRWYLFGATATVWGTPQDVPATPAR